MPQVSDPIADRLRRAPAPDAVRASAWDAFHEAADQDDLATRLRGLALPENVKADLWDLKGPTTPAAQPSEPDGGFVSEFWKRANPIETVKGLVHAAGDIPGTVKALITADPAFLTQAKEAAGKGDYLTAGRKVLSYAAMGLGPELDTQADLLASGQYAKGAGAMAGTATQMLAPELALKGAAAIPRVKLTSAKPDVAAAVRFGQDRGVPVDAAAATDNAAIRAIQHLSDRSLGGATVAGKAAQRQVEGLATLGEQLAAKAYPRPVVAGEAGRAAQKGVGGVVTKQRGRADDAYGRLREIEALPENAATFEPTPAAIPDDAPFQFVSKPKAKSDDIFLSALQDARKRGYKGSAAELKGAFDDRVSSARELIKATAEGDEYSHAALLKEIRARGGLRPYDKDYTPGAPVSKMRGEFQSSQQANAKYYGKNAVYRNDGLGVDDMLQQLSEDPKWGSVITPDTDLVDLLQRGASAVAKEPPDLQHALRGVGVQPGAKWWEPAAEAQTVQMAVDVAPVKAALQPIYDKLAAQHAVVPLSHMSAEGKAFVTLDAILKGPDVAPLSAVDGALGRLKTMARSKNSDLRSVGQGIAAKAVRELETMVGQAAERGGLEAVSALAEGRIATKAKYAAADVLKKLEGAQRTKSPVTAFRGMTQAGDTSIGHLREVLAQTPETKPLIARAVLDGLIDSPTAGAGKTLTDWKKLGMETKAALYTPEHIADLDKFFLLRKQIAENANPSGSAHAVAMLAQGTQLWEPLHFAATVAGSAGLSAFLHSPAGVKLLTRGMRLPPSAAAREAWLAKVKAFAAGQGAIVASQPIGTGPTR